MNDSPDPATVAPPRRRWPWLVAGAGGLALLAAWLLGGGGAPAGDGGMGAALLTAHEVAAASGAAGATRTQPPVDLGQVEAAARASLGAIPLPQGRAIATWQLPAGGHQVTEVLLRYEDEAQARRLDGLAVSMLPGAFGFEPEPLTLAGATDARRWRSDRYQAVSFRVGGQAVFIGSTDTSDPDLAPRLAASALARLARHPTGTP